MNTHICVIIGAPLATSSSLVCIANEPVEEESAPETRADTISESGEGERLIVIQDDIMGPSVDPEGESPL